ncbi:hypothetical protein AVEN_228587-1 [Araneus ventricosus]|uniref:Tc1-like transposase DDE domain-containing protein n=1 Tax=Araneus ventricosus TaxID=182803 RepID=A0A4Y2RAW2_ARAVE|nr:hypothetical protein AVEN_228587-1 [Araneus ventricosus]
MITASMIRVACNANREPTVLGRLHRFEQSKRPNKRSLSEHLCQPPPHPSRDQNTRDLTPSTTVPHPKGVMVWMGISANGVTPRFVQPGAKINSEHCIQKILKPFLKDDYCRLYPNGDAVSHQDSAPSHAARVTQKFLMDQQVQFLRPQQWMPNSPHAAPCDYFL